MSNALQAPEEYIGRKEVARRLNRCIRTIAYWIKSGRLPVRRMEGSVFFKWSEVEECLRSQEGKPQAKLKS